MSAMDTVLLRPRAGDLLSDSSCLRFRMKLAWGGHLYALLRCVMWPGAGERSP